MGVKVHETGGLWALEQGFIIFLVQIRGQCAVVQYNLEKQDFTFQLANIPEQCIDDF